MWNIKRPSCLLRESSKVVGLGTDLLEEKLWMWPGSETVRKRLKILDFFLWILSGFRWLYQSDFAPRREFVTSSVSLHGCSSLGIFWDLQLNSPWIFESCWWFINLMNQGWKGSFPMVFVLWFLTIGHMPKRQQVSFWRKWGHLPEVKRRFWSWKSSVFRFHVVSIERTLDNKLDTSAMLMAQKLFFGSSNHVAIEDFFHLRNVTQGSFSTVQSKIHNEIRSPNKIPHDMDCPTCKMGFPK